MTSRTESPGAVECMPPGYIDAFRSIWIGPMRSIAAGDWYRQHIFLPLTAEKKLCSRSESPGENERMRPAQIDPHEQITSVATQRLYQITL